MTLKGGGFCLGVGGVGGGGGCVVLGGCVLGDWGVFGGGWGGLFVITSLFITLFLDEKSCTTANETKDLTNKKAINKGGDHLLGVGL